MSLKPNSKTSMNNNEPEWRSTNAICSGPTSHNTYLTLKNTLDKLDIPKGMLNPPIYSSKDCPLEYLQMYSNLHMLRDTRIPNKKLSMPLNPSSSSMPSCLLNEAIILLRIVEIKEICLCTLRHLLEEMHCIAHSSPRTEEEDGTVTNNSDKEEEDKDNNNPSTTPPMRRNG